MSARRFYWLTAVLYLVGIFYLILHFHGIELAYHCPFKWIFHIPCAFCGTTRCVQALCHANWSDVWHYNLLGIPIFILLFILPPRLLYDAVKRQPTTYLLMTRWYQRLKSYALLWIILLVINWLWNICKGV